MKQSSQRAAHEPSPFSKPVQAFHRSPKLVTEGVARTASIALLVACGVALSTVACSSDSPDSKLIGSGGSSTGSGGSGTDGKTGGSTSNPGTGGNTADASTNTGGSDGSGGYVFDDEPTDQDDSFYPPSFWELGRPPGFPFRGYDKVPDSSNPSGTGEGAVCSVCTDSSDCSAGVCVVQMDTGELFCGADCVTDSDCPSPIEYECVEVDGADSAQCVPRLGSCMEFPPGAKPINPIHPPDDDDTGGSGGSGGDGSGGAGPGGAGGSGDGGMGPGGAGGSGGAGGAP